MSELINKAAYWHSAMRGEVIIRQHSAQPDNAPSHIGPKMDKKRPKKAAEEEPGKRKETETSDEIAQFFRKRGRLTDLVQGGNPNTNTNPDFSLNVDL